MRRSRTPPGTPAEKLSLGSKIFSDVGKMLLYLAKLLKIDLTGGDLQGDMPESLVDLIHGGADDKEKPKLSAKSKAEVSVAAEAEEDDEEEEEEASAAAEAEEAAPIKKRSTS